MTVEVRGVSVHYGARRAVCGVDLCAEPGRVLAVIGANGSGKTSLLRAIAGLVPYDGAVRATGRLGYMPQDNAARAALTVFEVVLLGRLRSLALRVAREDLCAAEAALGELGIGDFANRRIGELSGGQRQLVFLAQVLAGDPDVLLLDEPTSALDIAHQIHVLAMLREVTRRRGLTTLAVLHDLNAAARFADGLALMSDGHLIARGPPRKVLTVASLRAAFGVEAAIIQGPDGEPVVVPVGLSAHARIAGKGGEPPPPYLFV